MSFLIQSRAKRVGGALDRFQACQNGGGRCALLRGSAEDFHDMLIQTSEGLKIFLRNLLPGRLRCGMTIWSWDCVLAQNPARCPFQRRGRIGFRFNRELVLALRYDLSGPPASLFNPS